MKIPLLSLILVICLLFARAYVLDLDEELQARLGEVVRAARERSKNASHEDDVSASKYEELQALLMDILSSSDTNSTSILAEFEELKGDDARMTAEINLDGEGSLPPSCDSHLSCEACVSNSCAWCIITRSCRPDRAWECQGEDDHVGLGGIGSHTTCPNLEEIDRKRAEKRRRREEAERERLEEKAKLENLRDENYSTNNDSKSEESNKPSGQDKIDRWNELKRRSDLSLTDGYGAKFPYETLNLDVTCSTADIKKQYRRLSVQLHPDKNTDADLKEMAERAFKDLADAHGILSDPAKRAMYDDVGSGEEQEAFDSQEAYERYGKENHSNFYANDKNISPLTQSLWERRVGSSDQVWLVEFYAPWCSACQRMVDMYKEIAEQLAEDANIEVGAVNCETQKDLCAEYGISSYPTLIALNEKWRTSQLHQQDPKTVSNVVSWMRIVSREWKYLFHTSNVEPIANLTDFQNTVINSSEFWVVAFMDGMDCGPCKTAKTNCMRLSASLRGYPDVRVGLVDCEEEEARELCYVHQKLPARPHAPVVKGFPSGVKAENGGELLYNANEVEPHIGLRMLDSAIRLVLASSVKPGAVGAADGSGGFEADQKDEPDDPPKPPPEPLWNGPVRRPPLPWNTGSHGAPIRPRIGG